MASTLSLFEIQLIVDSAHGDPHQILGMHEIELDDKKLLSMRAFVPGAKHIKCIDCQDETNIYPLELVHKGGFFEGKIWGRTKWFRYKLEIEDAEGDIQQIYDAYSFAPAISDFDIYLFSQGNHYEIYEKLGTHICEMDGIPGTSFGVWAPNAARVSVIGRFNSWDGRRHTMRNLNNSGVWELFIPDLGGLEPYKFEIRGQSGSVFEKSDPYCNYAELRPSTSSLIYNMESFNWSDADWVKKRNTANPLKGPVNIYEVHLGSWKRPENTDGFFTYTEIADDLITYVKGMGYTHIEIMPITEYPYDGSWGYRVTGYFAPTSRYGTPEQLMEFVDKFHKAGIGVILDWVPAHFPKDGHGLARFDGSPLYEHGDPKRAEHPEWGTLKFDYGRNEVRNFLISSALFWVEKYHVDGLRIDAVASMLYLDYGAHQSDYIPNSNGGKEDYDAVEFMKHLNSVLLKRNPNVLMIAEESTSWPGVTGSLNTGGLGFNFKWNIGWMNDFLEYIKQDPIFRRYYNNNITFSMMYNYGENSLLPLSHDEVVHGKKSLLDKMPGDLEQKFAGLRVAYGFMVGHPGKKLLFMGGEFGQFGEWSEARSLDWHLLDFDHHKQMQNFVRDLNHFYLKNEALWYKDYDFSGFEWINCSNAELNIFSFLRRGKKDNSILVFVCNFAPVIRENFRLGVPLEGMYTEVLNSDYKKYGGTGVGNTMPIASEKVKCDNKNLSIAISLPPMGVSVFKYKAMKQGK